ncbi:MAG: hypothetical protein AAF125_07850, partial [Chloroflexota bacterium]
GLNWRWLMAALFCFGVALFARRGAIFAAPALLLIGFPYIDRLFRPVWVRWLVLIAFVVLVGCLYYATIPQSAQAFDQRTLGTPRHDTLPWFERMVRASINQGVQGYLFSIGGSIWGTSPIILLAIPGMFVLGARNRMRYPLAAITAVLTYATAYAYVTNFDWFGGLSWPPRFLVPIVPLVMLCVLPVVDTLMQKSVRLWMQLARTVALVIVGYSIWIQFNAVSYWWGTYATLLPAAADGFTEWAGGLYDPRYLRWVLLPTIWGEVPFDFAWVRTGSSFFVVPFLLLIVGSVWYMTHLFLSRRSSLWANTALPLLWLSAIGFGLTQIHEDDLYLAFSDGLWRAVPEIQSQMEDHETLLVAELGHERFFLNYGAINNRIISLPEHPGEQPSPDQPPLVSSANPADLIEKPTAQMIDTLIANGQDRIWLLADSSPFVPWSVLPLERYLALYHYPLATVDLTGEDGLPVRLLSYYAGTVHQPFDLSGPRTSSDLRFGDDISLVGFTLPDGDTYTSGDVLPISLAWSTDAPLEAEYRIALHLVRPEVGVIASAQDSAPYSGFAPTTSWDPGMLVWDNRAIALPASLEPGEYELWVGVYATELLSVTGAATAESDTLGVLPVQITITPSE